MHISGEYSQHVLQNAYVAMYVYYINFTCIKGNIPKKAHNTAEKVRTVICVGSSYSTPPSVIISAKY